MKLKMKSFVLKAAQMAAGLAVFITAFNVNSTCVFYSYQEELPPEADKLSKVK